jgi:hypothetical protein
VSLKDDLMTLATAFADSKGWQLSTLGARVRSDQRFFVNRVPNGKFAVASGDQAMMWFAANWPADLPWPKGIERPSRAKRRRLIWEEDS